MRKFIACVLFFVALSGSPVNAQQGFSMGVGVGTLYSGLGANFALSDSKNMKYISLGCVGHSEGSSGRGEACGPGLGWVTVDWMHEDNNKHGLILFAGPVAVKRDDTEKNDTVYGISVGYSYFFRGLGNTGLNAGVSIGAGRKGGETEVLIMPQLGFQF